MQIDVLEESNKSQRVVISFVYRLILIVYSVFLVLKYDLDITTIYYYIIYTVGFFTVFILLFTKKGLFSVVRLINDYAFIGVVVYFTNTLDIYTFSFLFIPILNAQNHTKKKKSPLLYTLPIIIIYLVLEDVDLFIILPFIAFASINSFKKFKNKYQIFYNRLNTSLDNFLVQDNALDKIHDIYEIIIPIFNEFRFFNKKIEDVFCFQYENSNLNIVNGSKFVLDFEFLNPSELLFQKRRILYNKEVIINDESIQENVIIKISDNTNNYVFLLVPKKNDHVSFSRIPIYYEILSPFLSRLTTVFNFKRVQMIDKQKNYNDLAKKVTYVNNAINSMHFTRNKLTPLKTYLSMIDDYEDVNTSEVKREKIKPYLKKEKIIVEMSLKQILERANQILEKSNNPFNVIDNYDVSFKVVLSKVREALLIHLDSSLFDFNIEQIDLSKNHYVRVNETGLDLVFSNWFSNVSKYKADDTYGAVVVENEESYVLRFFNSFINRNHNTEPGFVEDFNSDNRMAILRRKTHGLIEIKSFLEQMNIKGKLFSKDSLLFFELKFIKTVK